MQALDLVRPPCDRRPTPFGQQRRVMPLILCKLANLLREFQRLREIVDRKDASQLFFLIPKVDTLFVPEELHELPGRGEPSRSISVRGSTAQPHCLHESIVMVARERDQGGVALHSCRSSSRM